jgi:hypothetical protein
VSKARSTVAVAETAPTVAVAETAPVAAPDLGASQMPDIAALVQQSVAAALAAVIPTVVSQVQSAVLAQSVAAPTESDNPVRDWVESIGTEGASGVSLDRQRKEVSRELADEASGVDTDDPAYRLLKEQRQAFIDRDEQRERRERLMSIVPAGSGPCDLARKVFPKSVLLLAGHYGSKEAKSLPTYLIDKRVVMAAIDSVPSFGGRGKLSMADKRAMAESYLFNGTLIPCAVPAGFKVPTASGTGEIAIETMGLSDIFEAQKSSFTLGGK